MQCMMHTAYPNPPPNPEPRPEVAHLGPTPDTEEKGMMGKGKGGRRKEGDGREGGSGFWS
eukprot:scaffold180593_cov28-Tisochrysis_lutea.AAC.4